MSAGAGEVHWRAWHILYGQFGGPITGCIRRSQKRLQLRSDFAEVGGEDRRRRSGKGVVRLPHASVGNTGGLLSIGPRAPCCRYVCRTHFSVQGNYCHLCNSYLPIGFMRTCSSTYFAWDKLDTFVIQLTTDLYFLQIIYWLLASCYWLIVILKYFAGGYH